MNNIANPVKSEKTVQVPEANTEEVGGQCLQYFILARGHRTTRGCGSDGCPGLAACSEAE